MWHLLRKALVGRAIFVLQIFRLENIMPTFEVGSRQHIKKRVQGTYYICGCMRTKGARVRPASRAYGDADPSLVCPTAAAAAAAAAAVMLREAHCCCRSEMWYISPSTVVVAPVTRKKLFLIDKTCEMQIFLVVAPPARTSVGYICHVRVQSFRLQIMCVESGTTHTTTSSTVY